MKHLTQWRPGIFVVTNDPCSSKRLFSTMWWNNLCTDDNLWVANLGWSALHLCTGGWVHLWCSLCWCVFWNRPSTRCISITLLATRDHNLPMRSREIAMGVLFHLGWRIAIILCASYNPPERFAWLWETSCNGTCSRPSEVTGRRFQEIDFKIDYLFCPVDIWGH